MGFKFREWLVFNRAKITTLEQLKREVGIDEVLEGMPIETKDVILQFVVLPALHEIRELSEMGWTNTDFKRMTRANLIKVAEDILVGPPYPKPRPKAYRPNTW